MINVTCCHLARYQDPGGRPRPPDVAASYNNIGAVYGQKDDLENALLQFKKEWLILANFVPTNFVSTKFAGAPPTLTNSYHGNYARGAHHCDIISMHWRTDAESAAFWRTKLDRRFFRCSTF